MKKAMLLIIFMAAGGILFAQQADSLQKLARMQMQQAKFEQANQTLTRALQQKPNDLDLLKDQNFAYYLARDYVNSLQTGKALTERPDADEQCFQLLGLTYKALAEYKEGDKMYKAAIKKFPKSGVIYSEYGDLLSLNNQPDAAIDIWEKGIMADVNHNNNYYYAAKFYAANGNLFRCVMYAEIFVNIESFTPRTIEIKNILFEAYKKLLTSNNLANINSKSTGFTKAVTNILVQNNSTFPDTPSIENMTDVRAKFIAAWYSTDNAKQYPYRLFVLHRQLIENKSFDAYNQWLFGPVADNDKYEKWVKKHASEMQQWLVMLHSIVFKIPDGQYYE